MLTILIPVFNEKEAIEETVRKTHDVLTAAGEEFEILAINDGSTDGSTEMLEKIDIPTLRVIHHKRNIGYGASMKTGIRHAKGDIIGTTDADGTYPIEDFPKLLAELRKNNSDMVVGSRTKKGVKIPLIRRPAKAVVSWLANVLTGIKIPDVNSGLRVFKRDMSLKFMHLYPQQFSFTITITLAAITSDYLVDFVEIDYFKRKGSSSLSSGMNGIKNFINFLGLIIRITTYFRPLKFFMWPAVIFFIGGVTWILHTLIVEKNISDAGMLLTMTGLQIGLFGLLAEVVVRHGRAKL